MRRLLATLALAAVGLVACGGDDNPTLAGGDTATTAPARGAAGGSASGGAQPKEFCNAHAKNEALGELSGTMSDPRAMRAALVEAEANLDKAVETAPSEIRADMKVFADAYRPFIRAMIKADLDFSKIDMSSMSALQDPKTTVAIERIAAYYNRVCR